MSWVVSAAAAAAMVVEVVAWECMMAMAASRAAVMAMQLAMVAAQSKQH